ncbi:MAG: DUF4012 domain-containing protein [Candidatus Magasanikbacteria bacterium]
MICNKVGHNTRTCPTLRIVKKQIPEENKKKDGAFVGIKISSEMPRSPFVLDIASQIKKENHFEKINAYKNNQIKSEHKKIVVDFASIIKETNKNYKSIDNTPKKEKVFSKKEKKSTFKVTRANKLMPRFYFVKKIKNNFKSFFLSILSFSNEIFTNFVNSYRNFSNHFSFKRFSVSLLVLLILISLPFPAFGYYKKVKSDTSAILAKSNEAFLALQSSTVSAFHNDIDKAEMDLNLALSSFASANEILDKEYKAMLYVAKLMPVVGDKVKSRQDLLLAGQHLTLGNAYLVKGIDEATKDESTINLIARLEILQQHLKGALREYKVALEKIENIDEKNVPIEYQESFSDFKLLFASFVEDMNNVNDVIWGIQLFMGGDGFKRYLVLFQNTFELRPTGGFVGSYAVVDVQSGKILDIDVPGEGSYDFQGQLDVYNKPPLPLQLVNKRWEFQDGNWFPDFAESAQKMSWFFQHGKNVTVDGVIAINSSVLERLLKVIGPLQTEDYSLLLKSENALTKIESEVRNYNDLEENKPKQILSVLLEQILSSVSNIKPNSLLSLVTELHEALTQKEIQLYFNDSYVQNVVKDYGWTGDVLNVLPKQDYLFVVNSNIGGEKSDFQIDQKIEHQAVVQEDGSVIDTVIITRKNTGQGGEIYYDANNINYLRIYVPEGSELLEASGFTVPDEKYFKVSPSWYEDDLDLKRIEQLEKIDSKTGTRITKEFGKTVFANWVMTEVGFESKVYFIYKIPFNVLEKTEVNKDDKNFKLNNFFGDGDNKSNISRYSVLLQKQSGSNSIINHSIIYPDLWKPVWKEGSQNYSLSINGASVEENFEKDKIFGIVMEK